jgi:hemerythrin-like metal-binding protein
LLPHRENLKRIAVGHPEIDSQHQKLIDLVNRLHDAMSKGKGRDVLGRILVELEDHTKYHFGTEEGLMDKHAYPGTFAQKQKHKELVGQLSAIMADAKQGKLTVTMETMNFLRSWLTDHIMGMDKKLSAFLSAKEALSGDGRAESGQPVAETGQLRQFFMRFRLCPAD